jgi:formate-dependent nitrite reductase membrane component NrfD
MDQEENSAVNILMRFLMIKTDTKNEQAESLEERLYERLAALTTGYRAEPERELQEASYYDYPVVKEPLWRWEIIWYFFFGGLAAGCYVLATIASLFGSKEDRAVVRAGYYLSLLALLPCPLLLIKDLGRPEKFLNMLRMFKMRSPMSMGVYGLLAFSFFSGITAVIQVARDGLLGTWWGARLLARAPQKLLAIPGTIAGVFLGSYTGVLLAATSVPVWSRSKMLGAVFIASALSTSGALISFVLRIVGAPTKTLHKLERVEWFSMLVETTNLLLFLRGSGRAARALVGTKPTEQGPVFWRFMFGGGLVLPWLLQTLLLLVRGGSGQARQKTQRKGGAGLIVSLLVLVGGYFLRRTLIHAGHVSSRDARTTLWNARVASRDVARK